MFPEPDLMRFAVPIAMTPVTVVLPDPLNVRFPGPVILGAMLKRPDPLWSMSKSLLAVIFPILVPTVNSTFAVDPEAIEMLLLPELAENVRLRAVWPVLVEVNRVRKLVSALASYVRLRIVKLAPRKELLEFAVEFVLVALKVKSVVPEKAGPLDQFVDVDQSPEVVPVHVCPRTAPTEVARIAKKLKLHFRPNLKNGEANGRVAAKKPEDRRSRRVGVPPTGIERCGRDARSP
jgi:hypothetical protein